MPRLALIVPDLCPSNIRATLDDLARATIGTLASCYHPASD